MDILFTIVASVLLLVGFLVLCRVPDDEDEDDDAESSAESEASPEEQDRKGP